MRKAFLIFAVAVGFRCAVSAPALIKPERAYGMDTKGYLAIADNLIRGNGFSWDSGPPFRQNIVRTPPYPLILSALYSPFRDERPAMVFQIILGGILAVLVFFLGQRVSGDGLLPGLLAACDPFTAIFGAMLYTETLFAVLLTMGALLLFRGKNTLAGLAMGLACLTRPSGIILAIAGIYPAWKRDWVGLCNFIWGFLALPLMWATRNYLVSGLFTLSSVSDVNFYVFIGPMTRAEAQGTSYQEAWEASRPDLYQQYDTDPWRAANDPDFVREARKEGMREITGHPKAFALICAKGLLRGLGGLDFNLPSAVLADSQKAQGSLTGAIASLLHGDLKGFASGITERLSGTPPVALIYTVYSWLFLLVLYILAARGTRMKPEQVTCLALTVGLIAVAGPLASFRFRAPGQGLLEAMASWRRRRE